MNEEEAIKLGKKATKDLQRVIEELYGEKCSVYFPGCTTCLAWRALEDLVLLLEFEE